MEEKLKRGPEKNASVPYSGNGAPYVSAAEGRARYVTTPKTRESDKLYCPNDKANFTTGNKETTNRVETTQKAYLKGLPGGFRTPQQMKEKKLKQRLDCSMKYSGNGAPYVSAAEGRVRYVTTPKTRESDKLYCPNNKANFTNGNKETTKRVETTQKAYLKGLPEGFRTPQQMKERKLKQRLDCSMKYSGNGAPYISAAEGRVRYVTTPKTKESDKLYGPNDKANFTTGNKETTKRVETSQKAYLKRLPEGFRTPQQMKEKKLKRRLDCSMKYSDNIHVPIKKAKKASRGHIETTNMATKNRDVIDDSNYNQRGDMASTIINGARLQARRRDYLPYKRAENNDKNDGLEGDMNKTKKSVKIQECFVVMTMNTNGQNEKRLEEPQDKRRQVVTMLLETYAPDIMFCQEFQSTDIYGRVWSKYGISTNYDFDGNREGSILVHKKQFDVHSSVDGKHINTVLRRILEGLQRSSANALNKTFPLEFDPLSRMCMYFINLKDGKTREFLCASWHGWWNKKNREGRIELFIYLMEFLRQVVIKFNLPLIVGGDFNIDILDAKGIVNDPFSLGMYASSKRRKDKEKDFFIVSKDLRLENIQCIDYEEDTHFRAMLKEFNPNDILDHDPIKATLKFA